MPIPLIPQSLDSAVKKREDESSFRQSNDLIQKTRFNLSANEAKIWLYIIQKINPEDKELKPMEFSIRDFCHVAGINPKSGSAYQNVRNALKGIADASLYMDLDNSGDETLMRWLSSVKMSKKRGTATIQISEEMRPFLIDLKERYTTIALPYVTQMHSKYAIRLYQILKSYEYLKAPIYFTIAELKKSFELPPNYTIGNIKQRVLDNSIEEINSLTDMFVSYKDIKEGKVVTAIVFSMERVDVNDRDKRLANVEKQVGSKVLYELMRNTVIMDVEYDEVFENPPIKKHEEKTSNDKDATLPGQPIAYSEGKSKPHMLEAVLKRTNYKTIKESLPQSKIDTLESIMKTMASLGNKHGKAEVIVDGGNKINIDMINNIIIKYQTLDEWLLAILDKYENFFAGKPQINNPVPYLSKSVWNDIFNAETVVNNARAKQNEKQKDNDFLSKSMNRPRRLKRVD